MEISIPTILTAALTAQGQRVAAFKAWDAALAEFLKDGDVRKYRQQVNFALKPNEIFPPWQFCCSAKMLRQFLKLAAKQSKAALRDCSNQRLRLQVP
jgi:hypothetical protein